MANGSAQASSVPASKHPSSTAPTAAQLPPLSPAAASSDTVQLTPTPMHDLAVESSRAITTPPPPPPSADALAASPVLATSSSPAISPAPAASSPVSAISPLPAASPARAVSPASPSAAVPPAPALQDLPPTLRYSTAAREAAAEVQPLHHVGEYHSHATSGTPKGPDVHPPQAETASKRVSVPAGAHPGDLRPGAASPVLPAISSKLAQKPLTELRAGMVAKPFWLHTELLVAKSPYFADMQNTTDNPQPTHRLSGPFFFQDLDEFAVAHFVRWIYGGELHGPHDFHSMNHYLCLHVLGKRFRIEKLENKTMDLIREYYAADNMTSPPFRLEYIYNHTSEPCLMREFLVSTAAYRAFADAETSRGLSESMIGVLRKEGDIAPDFIQALLLLVKDGDADVRKGDPCRWHQHNLTRKCSAWGGLEPWQSA